MYKIFNVCSFFACVFSVSESVCKKVVGMLRMPQEHCVNIILFHRFLYKTNYKLSPYLSVCLFLFKRCAHLIFLCICLNKSIIFRQKKSCIFIFLCLSVNCALCYIQIYIPGSICPLTSWCWMCCWIVATLSFVLMHVARKKKVFNI